MYFLPYITESITASSVNLAITVAIAAPLTPNAGAPKLPKIKTQFIKIFTTDSQLIEISREGIMIIFAFFPIVGFQMVTGNFFQSVGMAGKAIFLSLSRQLIFLLPCLLILPTFMGVKGIWWSMPISDAMSSIIAGFLLIHQIKKFKKENNGI